MIKLQTSWTACSSFGRRRSKIYGLPQREEWCWWNCYWVKTDLPNFSSWEHFYWGRCLKLFQVRLILLWEVVGFLRGDSRELKFSILFSACRSFGPVQDVRIPCQQKRMFGFVTFVYPETVKIILTKGNPHFVCGARVLVKPYKEKSRTMDR